MALTTAATDLLKSIYELLSSIITTIYTVIQSILMAMFNFVSGFFTLAGDVFEGLLSITSGVGRFIIGNIVIVAVGAFIAFAYMRYPRTGQRAVASEKKTN